MTTLDVAMALPAYPPEAAPRAARVRPVVAALASLFWPGSGHFVAGRFGRGLLLAALYFDLLVLVIVLTIRGPIDGVLMYLPACVALALHLWIAGDAWRLARTKPSASWLRRWAAVLALVFAGGVIQQPLENLVRNRVGRTMRMIGEAMSPTLMHGDQIFVIPARPAELRRGDLVAWRGSKGRQFVFRLVGLPGDTLEMRGGTLRRNGRVMLEPYAQHRPAFDSRPIAAEWERGHEVPRTAEASPRTCGGWGPFRVPERSVFFLGDDRDHSNDSRFQGFARFDQLKGRAVRVYFSSGAAGIRWRRIGRALDVARRVKDGG